MRNKEYYEERFKDYPDLVNLEQFREMPVPMKHPLYNGKEIEA